jgi:plastocyanin
MRITRLGSLAALLMLVLAVALVAGCSSGGSAGTGGYGAPSGGSSTGGGTTPAAGGVTVVMKDIAFDKPSPLMKAGDTITFKNEDTAPHDIKIDGKDSGVIQPGSSWSLKIDKAGMYPFQCTIHPSMAGQLTVR